jgi:hypothetical protein
LIELRDAADVAVLAVLHPLPELDAGIPHAMPTE